MTVVIRADRDDRFVTINFDGILIDVENENPDIEFEVYLGGMCIGNGTGRDALDKALAGLRVIMDRELLKKLADAIFRLNADGGEAVFLANSGKAGLMLCEGPDYDRLGVDAFEYASDFLLRRFPAEDTSRI
ncbi:hypothetical protein [Agrobacterium sp. NPDC090273]|uniref:hypothetical protein n=1 Tax=Agrobacterium sp. NPDC090273 TaxID=3363919 RepID=UPI00383BD703